MLDKTHADYSADGMWFAGFLSESSDLRPGWLERSVLTHCGTAYIRDSHAWGDLLPGFAAWGFTPYPKRVGYFFAWRLIDIGGPMRWKSGPSNAEFAQEMANFWQVNDLLLTLVVVAVDDKGQKFVCLWGSCREADGEQTDKSIGDEAKGRRLVFCDSATAR